MVNNFIWLGVGVLIGVVLVIVYACCRLSGDIARRVERWVDDDL